MNIHPTSIIDKEVKIGKNVKIGPYCIIKNGVTIDDNTELISNVVIKGRTKIGKNNKIYSFSVIGEIPQDLKYEGEDSQLIIGDNNSIREHCTIHIGTKGDNMITKIGSNNLFMINTHIAHDCLIGDNCVFANNTTLAGHIHIDDNVIIGGTSAIHQHIRIGKGSMLGGMSGLGEDLIPYGMAYSLNGRKASLQGLNLIGLKRLGFDKKIIMEALKFYKDIFQSKKPIMKQLETVKNNYKNNEIINDIIFFLEQNTNRQICCEAL